MDFSIGANGGCYTMVGKGTNPNFDLLKIKPSTKQTLN